MSSVAPSPETSDRLAPEERYFNRELSWLAFNERVLAEASNPAYPLLERLRFLSISGSNLDEFMMIRVAGLAGQVRSGVGNVSLDGKTPSQQLAAINAKVRELEVSQQAILQELRPLLAAQGIRFASFERLDAATERWLKDYFLDHVMPVITPQAIDPAHPFPFVSNKGIGVLFNLARHADDSRLLDAEAVQARLDAGDMLIDARAADRFRGENEMLDRLAGHVPGARSRPYADNLADGRLKAPMQLADEYRALLGELKPDQAMVMCGSGVTACHHLLAMERAGLRGARLFTGSWSGWISDPARPVATGPA